MLIVGERLHPEVIGLIGWSGGDTFVACSEEECATLSAGKELAVVAQTTCPEEIFEKIVKFVSKGREKTVEIFKTICYTTKERQEEAEQLAKNSDAMLVIGGANSSNTNRLKEICSRYCANVFRLTDASEFRSDLLKNFKKRGGPNFFLGPPPALTLPAAYAAGNGNYRINCNPAIAWGRGKRDE